MERTVVIYKGRYGTTKQYAEWIAEELDCDILEADKVLSRDFDNYDNIIFGGAVQAGGIKGFDLIKRNRMKLLGKKVVIFAVGINVNSQANRIQIREINFDRIELAGMTVYYCMGAFDPKKIKGMDRTIINLTLKMLKKKKEEDWTEDEKRLYHDMTEGGNYVDRKYIEPIIAEFKPAKIEEEAGK